ncbi:MAG: hypothetical protein M0Z38_12845 [Deltaproteobacteria bacterium]|nr:hypothetical protein [Deltaproteobacteria bacterium]
MSWAAVPLSEGAAKLTTEPKQGQRSSGRYDLPPSRKLAPGEAHRGKEPEPKG